MEPAVAADARGGIVVPPHGMVSARPLTAAMVHATECRGGTLVADCHVDRVTVDGREARIHAGSDDYAADAVVLAAGSWSGQVEVEGVTARLPVRPVRGQLLQLAWNGPLLRRVIWSERCYLVPWEDGTLLVGATVEEAGYYEAPTDEATELLLRQAIRAVPSVADLELVEAVASLRPGTPDDGPLIGEWDGFGTPADYTFTSITISPEKGPYYKFGSFSQDFDGDYIELGYTYSMEDAGVDLSIALVGSDDLQVGDPDDGEGGDWKLTFGIKKNIGFGE